MGDQGIGAGEKAPCVSAIVLDAGAFIAVENNDRLMMARLREAQRQNRPLRTCAIIIAQVWRGPRLANLARLLQSVDVLPVDKPTARAAGTLLAKTGTVDPNDAALVLVVQNGDHILTGDPADISVLVTACGRRGWLWSLVRPSTHKKDG